MNKKILISVGVIIAGIAGVVAMSAYEAHVINVTAHIENALYVHPDEILFGTVFPQEYVEKQFTVELSSSFRAEDRVDDVEYVIKQKPKCECIFDPIDDVQEFDLYCEGKQYAPVDYATHACPVEPDGSVYYKEMANLCQFLSKTDADPEDGNDTDHRSYFQGTNCLTTPDPDATGRLSKIEQDIIDLWIVDLKVPPVDGYVGQDWPAGCPVVAANDMDYGCDLWIEVTNISLSNGENTVNHNCNNGIIEDGEECDDGNNIDGDGCSAVCTIETQPEPEPTSECVSGDIKSCDTGQVGVCIVGTQTCVQGFWDSCVQDVQSSAEACDGLDNDCDGEIDEGDVCNSGPAPECTFLEIQSCDTQLLGVCAAGTQACNLESFWGSCVQNEQSSAEVCDGLDNDCDGEIDEGDICVSVNNWTYEQNFNGLSSGNLSGQDEWSGPRVFYVQDSVTYEGAKAVEIIGGPGTDEWARRDITGISDGLVYIAMRRNNTDDGNTVVALRDSGTDVMLVKFDATGYYRIRSDTAWVNVATYNADQWYVVAIEFDDLAQNDKYRTRIHDGSSWSSWSNWENTLNSYSDIDQILFMVDSVTNGVTAYWDRISATGI